MSEDDLMHDRFAANAEKLGFGFEDGLMTPTLTTILAAVNIESVSSTYSVNIAVDLVLDDCLDKCNERGADCVGSVLYSSKEFADKVVYGFQDSSDASNQFVCTLLSKSDEGDGKRVNVADGNVYWAFYKIV